MSHLIVLTRPEAKNQHLASALLESCCATKIDTFAGSSALLPVVIEGASLGAIESTFLNLSPLHILSLPALQLTAFDRHELSLSQQMVLNQFNQFDAVFCVSAQAVECLFQLLPKQCLVPKCPVFLCVGKATRDSLIEHGVSVDKIIYPKQGNDSEALLALLIEQGLLATWQHILIVRAEKGRDWFQEQLQQRHIDVQTLSVYQRVPVQLTEQQRQWFADLPQQTNIQWVFTSSESVSALLPQLYDTGIFANISAKAHHFWVIHERIAQTIQHQIEALSQGKNKLLAENISLVSAENAQISKAIAKHLNIIG